jgi:hypothetical protein
VRVVSGVIEDLGSEITVIVTIDAPYVEHASLAQAAEASADEDEASANPDGRQIAVYAPGLRGPHARQRLCMPLAPTETSP